MTRGRRMRFGGAARAFRREIFTTRPQHRRRDDRRDGGFYWRQVVFPSRIQGEVGGTRVFFFFKY